MPGPLQPSEWELLEGLFEQLRTLAPSAWDAALDAAGVTDEALRARVRSMLMADAIQDRFLEPGAGQAEPRSEEAPDLLGTRAGPYRLVASLGEGGMGAIYLGERVDGRYRGRVALKVLRPCRDEPELHRRFRAECDALARLVHPSIGRLYDAGTLADGRPYLVMEHVEGVPLDAFCDRRRLSLRERLGLFLEVCDAVAFAHRHLVVHRDLKPSNILVTLTGRTKLIDFGVARLLAGGGAAEAAGPAPLTPGYAAPEELAGVPATTAADVFSLGVVLHELLVGRRPVRDTTRTRIVSTGGATVGADTVELAGIARARRCSSRKLLRSLRGGLGAILARALEEDPAARYADVSALAEDVRAYLAHRPVVATDPGPLVHARAFVRRHRVPVALAVLAALSLTAGLLVARQEAVAARAAEGRAVAAGAAAIDARREAEDVTRFLQGLLASVDEGRPGRDVLLVDLLTAAVPRLEAERDARPAYFARTAVTLARSFAALGRAEDARRLFDQAVEALEARSGPDSGELVEPLAGAGRAAYESGDLGPARGALQRALRLHMRDHGADDLVTARLQNDLAVVLRSGHDDEAAERLLLAALSTRKRLAGSRSLEAAETKNNLSGLRRVQGRLEEAERLQREVLAARRAALPPEHPLVLQSVSNLGVVRMGRGALEDAEPLLREAVALAREVLGAEHLGLATHLSNLSSLAVLRGELAAAEDLRAECLAIRRLRLAPDSPLLQVTVGLEGELLVRLGRCDEGLLLLEEALTYLADTEYAARFEQAVELALAASDG